MDSTLSPPEDLKCVPAELGLGEVLFNNLKLRGEQIAQIDATTGRTITYNEILNKSICIAQEMKARGMTEKDIVSLCVHDSIEGYLPLIASLFLGMKSSCLDPTLSEHNMIRLLTAVKPRIIFADADCVDKIESSLYKTGLKTEIVVFGDAVSKMHTPVARFMKERGSESKFLPKSVKDLSETALINFTSGTSGLPRAVQLSHYALIYRTNYDIINCPANVSLYCGLTWWISGISGLMKCIISGNKNIICSKPTEETIFKYIKDYQIESVVVDSTLLKTLSNDQDYSHYDVSNLKHIFLAGSTIDEDKIEQIRKQMPSVIVANMYGMTELCGRTFAFQNIEDKEFIDRKGISCGQPLPGISYKIVDIETDKPLGPNKIGELRMKSKLLMNGYYNLHDDTSKSYDNEGYLQTGDLFYYDEDSCFYFVERLQDLIKYQTCDISSDMVVFIMAHPDIREAVAVDVSNEKDEQRPLVVVKLKEGSKVTEQSLRDSIRSEIEDSRLKEEIKVVNHIPKTPTGILLRKEFRTLA